MWDVSVEIDWFVYDLKEIMDGLLGISKVFGDVVEWFLENIWVV